MKWLRIDEAAVAAGVTERTIIRWVNSGLPARHEDGHWLIDPEALVKWKAMRATHRALGLRST